jgi:ElaB/YqjD/DUF883 family membrane-anchored ribosome-binding protein
MDNYRSSNVLTDPMEVRVPSGLEVESATLIFPGNGGQHTSGLTEEASWKSRLSALRDRGLTSLRDHSRSSIATLRRGVTTRVNTLKPMMTSRVDTVRAGVRSRLDAVDNRMRANPAKWAGIAAGAGLLLGMTGRVMRGRSRHHHHPTGILVIESC